MNYAQQPIVFIDIETPLGSGEELKPRMVEIIEIALVPNDNPLGCFYSRVRPTNDNIATLAGSRYDKEIWKQEPRFAEIAEDLRRWVEGASLAGHNVIEFDRPCLDAAFDRIGMGVPKLGWPPRDTQQLALELLVPHGLERLSLQACCDFVGVKNQGAHSALSDCRAAHQLYQRLRQLGHIPFKERAAKCEEWRAPRKEFRIRTGRTTGALAYEEIYE